MFTSNMHFHCKAWQSVMNAEAINLHRCDHGKRTLAAQIKRQIEVYRNGNAFNTHWVCVLRR